MIKEYQEWCVTKFNLLLSELGQSLALINCAMGLSGESGEVSELIKKHVFHGKPLDLVDLSEELGDVLFYLCVLANEVGIKIEDIIKDNQRKLNQRYPDGFTKGGN